MLCSISDSCIATVFGILSYFANLIESYFSSTRKYLTNSVEGIVNLYDELERLQKSAPSIIFNAECYHFETRTRTVYYQDANGNTQSRIETYQERVLLHIQHIKRCK